MEYLLDVVGIFGYSGTSEIASNSWTIRHIGQSERGPRCSLLIGSDKKTLRHS